MIKVTKFNIAKPEKYTKDNEEKTYWANIGSMTVFQKDDGSVNRIIEIPAIGLKANIFPITPKDKPQNEPEPADQSKNQSEEDNSEDIPF